ncbi:MAG: tRNA dihydrouridine synthase DusB [Bacilli bacterium]|nr:tRNA dihydrouridine synthase DusB [Bacilli bacterium]
MKIGNILINNIVASAPLAGYSNLAFREIMKEHKAGLVFTEMISAKGLLYKSSKTWELTKISEKEHPVALQLFGGDIEDLRQAAILIEQNTKADIIDLNMGCPVKKVLKSNSGSALLLDKNKVYEMVKAVVESVSLPVTVKIRAGWDHDSINCIEIAKAIEAAKASAITIHGRTKSDLYRGKVNLDYIKMVKASVNIPVIGNGDIKSVEDAIEMLEYTKCDMVMVGRGVLGNPWLIENIVNRLEGLPLVYPSKEEIKNKMLKHFTEMIDLKQEKVAVLEFKSIAGFYLKGFSNAKEMKLKIVNAKRSAEIMEVIKKIE